MKKLFIENYFNFFLILFISLIVFFIGVNDTEEYELGSFSSRILWDNQYGLFTFFYDFYGPGVTLPFGTGNLFHPLNFIFDYTKYYYLIYIFLHLFIQLYFTKKIFKLLKINFGNYLFPFLLILNAPNIQYLLMNDWPSVFFSYSFFPLIFYYFLKIMDKQKLLHYLKLSLFTYLWLINGHIGVIVIYLFFLLFYFLLSIKKIDYLKKILNKYFLLSVVCFILLISEYVYYHIISLSGFEKFLHREYHYSFGSFIQIFFPFKDFLTWLPSNQLPGNPILIFFSLFASIYILTKYAYLNFLINKKNFRLKNFLVNYYLYTVKKIEVKFSILFLIFISLSVYEPPFYRVIVSQGVNARDMFLFAGLILFFNLYPKIKNEFKKIINILLIFYTLLLFSINFENLFSNKENNFIVDKFTNSNLINTFSNLKLNSNDFNRIYLSPHVFKNITKDYKQDGFFGLPDFTKYNLVPFNGYFKYNSMRGFFTDRRMQGNIPSAHKYLNSDFFLDLFEIKYLLISKNDLSKFDQKNNFLISIIKTKKDTLYLFKRKNLKYSLNEQNYDLLKNNLELCNELLIDCILNNKKLFYSNKIQLTRLSNGYFLARQVDNNYYFLPFVFNKNWKAVDGKIDNIKNFFMLIKAKNNKITNLEIKYTDTNRYILKIISFLMFSFILSLIFFISFKSILKKNYYIKKLRG